MMEETIRVVASMLAFVSAVLSVRFLIVHWHTLDKAIRRIMVPYSVLTFLVMLGIIEHLRTDSELTFAVTAGVPVLGWLAIAYLVERSERLP